MEYTVKYNNDTKSKSFTSYNEAIIYQNYLIDRGDVTARIV